MVTIGSASRDWQHAGMLSAGRHRAQQLLRSTAVRVLVVLVAAAALWHGASALWARVLSRLHVHRHLSWYGLGLHGLAPSEQLESLPEARVPQLEFPRWDARCSQDPVFFGWRGHNVDEPGAVILDARGGLVWRHTGSATDQNDVRPQMYRGERFLTFQMDGPDGDQAQGYWYMLDESYTVRYKVRPGNGFPHADMHEFQLTDDDTALVITSVPVPADLSSIGGPVDGWVENDYFQELDVETGEVLFQWASLDHFPVNTTMEAQDNCRIDPFAKFAGCGDDEGSAFDYYHLNSISKDSLGNYLISARNVWAISYIDGRTGDVLWTLGAGTVNDFADISGGLATDFAWQHHARWVDEGRTLSFFDNHYHRIGDPYGPSGARVVDLGLDEPANRTARLRHLYEHPDRMRPESQGNAQRLAHGGYLVGWGSSGAFTEFAADGEVLCDARFGAEAAFEFSPVSSYRVFRGAWTGSPSYPPSVAVVGNKAYVSWNGATEVERWQVERAVGDDGDQYDDLDAGYDELDEQDEARERQRQREMAEEGGAAAAAEGDPDAVEVEVEVLAQEFKTGFETVIDLPKAAANSRIRLVALGAGGERLSETDFLLVPAWSLWGLTPYFVMILGLIGIFLTALCGAVVWWTCACRRSRDEGGRGGRGAVGRGYRPLDLEEVEEEEERLRDGGDDRWKEAGVSLELQESLDNPSNRYDGGRK